MTIEQIQDISLGDCIVIDTPNGHKIPCEVIKCWPNMKVKIIDSGSVLDIPEIELLKGKYVRKKLPHKARV